MRKKKVEGEYQPDSWPKGPESSLCPLARPDIAMGPESQIEAWSVRVYDASRPLVRIARSHLTAEQQQRCQKQKRLVIVSGAITLFERREGLGCQGQRHRGRGRNTLDIPLHRRNLWEITVANGCHAWCPIETEARYRSQPRPPLLLSNAAL